MRKLSEYKNEEAIELLADILEPTTIILADKDIANIINTKSKIEIITAILKAHKKEVIQILATLDGVKVEDYSCNVFTLPMKILEIFNDKDIQSFFKSQFQSSDMNAFGSVTENIEETEAE